MKIETESREPLHMAYMADCNFDDVIEYITSKLEGNPICKDVRQHLMSISSTADLRENQRATER